MASFSLTGLSTSATYTCTYQNVSDTCTVILPIFYDSCAIDNTNLYTQEIDLENTNTTCTLAYDSTNQDYILQHSGGNYFVGLAIPNARGLDNVKMSVKFKLGNNNAYNQILLGVTDYTTPQNNYDFARVRGDRIFDACHNTSVEIATKSNVYTNGTWATLELIKIGTSFTGKVYDENDNLIETLSWTGNTYSNPYLFIGGNGKYNSTSYFKHIKDILVSSI